MFFHWLTSIFPAQMIKGWRLLRRDLALWVALFALLAVASVSSPASPEGGLNLAVLIHTSVALIATILPAVLFQAASTNEEVRWTDVLEIVGRRILPLIFYSSLGVVLSFGASSLVGIGLITLLEGTPLALPLGLGLGTMVLITLLVRFCFLPFFVVLHNDSDIPELAGPWGKNPLLRTLTWPLLASSRLGEGLRWSIAPYVIISRLGPFAVLAVPSGLLLPFLVFWQLFMLTAQAVLYDYFESGCSSMGVKPRPLRAKDHNIKRTPPSSSTR